MALSLITNLPSLRAGNQLLKAQASTNLALARLASGFRINSARDDAAGLAIATRFSAQISGQNVARRNAADGISLAQTAEGALNEITSNLQRIRELSLQSANATNSDSDRQALDAEVQQRIEEIDRIASQTAFNGLKVLDGSLEELRFQVGANVGQTISLDLQLGVRASQVGSVAQEVLGFDDTAFTDGGLTNAASLSLTVGEGVAVTVDLAAGLTREEIALAIREVEVPGLVTAEIDGAGLRLLAGESITLGEDFPTLFENAPLVIELSGSLADGSITTVAGANASILRSDNALESVNRLRSQLGAIQNRFESTINNLDNSTESLSAARSRIVDADFAAEAARLIRSQILEQVAIAILAQANSRPQQILPLLG
ncbi:MAG: flagellin [Oleiphilaceae bacterium]|nr:flagellin [Oleiphilaceae bacterium]